jgi:hypothetical protein
MHRPRGLTDLGAYLIRRMIAKHMMIEADHMSEKTRDAVLAIIAAAQYPVVSSHNGTGGSWSASQLSTLYGAGGMVAVTPDTASPLAAKILALRHRRIGWTARTARKRRRSSPDLPVSLLRRQGPVRPRAQRRHRL